MSSKKQMFSGNRVNVNVQYSRKKWAGYLRFTGFFLYTEKVHYDDLYVYLNQSKGLFRSGSTLLEIGFGSGYNLKKLARKYGFRTIGADIIQETVSLYNAQKIPNSHAVKIDPYLNSLDFQDNSIDVAVCSHVLEHVPDDQKLVHELARVLRPGGFVFFNVPLNEEKLDVPSHIRKYTPEKFTSLIRQNSFYIEKSVQNDPYSQIINYLGIHRGIILKIAKKILLTVLSVFPVRLMKKFFIPGTRPSQLTVIAVKKSPEILF